MDFPSVWNVEYLKLITDTAPRVIILSDYDPRYSSLLKKA